MAGGCGGLRGFLSGEFTLAEAAAPRGGVHGCTVREGGSQEVVEPTVLRRVSCIGLAPCWKTSREGYLGIFWWSILKLTGAVALQDRITNFLSRGFFTRVAVREHCFVVVSLCLSLGFRPDYALPTGWR